MGGQGSGQWYRWNSKQLVEDCLELDINLLVRKGYIKPGIRRYGTLRWTRVSTGEETSTCGYEANTLDADFPWFQLHYQIASAQEQIDYKVPLTTTRPNYGGIRWWFRCPGQGCSRRVMKIYLGGKYYLCRHCHDLVYESQRESPIFRYMTKTQKIRRKLGGSASLANPFPEKPKGMHWQTYFRLHQKAFEAERKAYSSWAIFLKMEDVNF